MTMPSASDLLLPLAMAVAAGLVGSYAVMRRMTLASDAISHVALPGVGIAILLNVNPVLGALAALILGTLLIWAVERQARIPTEAIIGVVFSAALAVGSMLASGEELLDALFGAPRAMSGMEVVLGLAAALLVIGFLVRARSRLVIALVSPDLARTTGINVSRIDLLFLLSFALTVALGLRFLGVLLMGSLIIIPAATAKQVAGSLRGMQATSVAIAVVATVAGTLIAPSIHRETGPVVIIIAALGFFASLMVRRER
ncbi:MAG TPA: metal ABC transporter permease [Gemmatimonadaceae bacterium]|nr:metal ABC transporter permease [Gemmatimonadaceae bacterium]